MTNKPISRKANIVVQDLETEVLIYDLKINKAFCLNQTSREVWHLCDGKHSVADIAKSLSDKLQEPVPEDLIWLALYDLKRDELLENNEQFEIGNNGLNRRQVIRKIGFASMVMLPLISSVVAPSAVCAQSGCVAPSGVVTVTLIPGLSVEQCFPGLRSQCCSGVVGIPDSFTNLAMPGDSEQWRCTATCVSPP